MDPEHPTGIRDSGRKIEAGQLRENERLADLLQEWQAQQPEQREEGGGERQGLY